MPSKCLNCGKYAVVWDDYSGSSDQQVCSACGAVNCDGELVSETHKSYTNLVTETNNKLKGLPDSYIKYQMLKMPEGLKVGRAHIRTLCSNMKLSSTFQEEALEQYEDLYHRPDFKKATIETKTRLSSWCVYIACRKAGLPITMQYVANITGHPLNKLFSIHHYCREIMNIHLPLQDITELIETVLSNELKPGITYTETTKQLTKDIVMLCKDLWLVEGRHTHLVLLSVFFIAWQAESFIERRKKKVTMICKNKSSVKTCRERIAEYKKELFKLAQLIPWVSNVSMENVTYYVKDVLKYQRSLMLDALKKSKEQSLLKSENQSDAGNHSLKRSCNDEHSQSVSEQNGHHDQNTEIKDITKVPEYENEKSYDSIASSSNSAEDVSKIVEELRPNEQSNICKVIKKEPGQHSETESGQLSIKAGTEYFKKLKEEVEVEHLFMPPSFKKARRKSIEKEEVLHFVKEGRRMMENIARQFNDSP